MAGRTFRCQLITPEAAALDTQATFCAITAHDGEIGILPNRAPLVCKLGIGELRISAADGSRLSYYIDGGFAEVAENQVSVLTQKAIPTGDLEVARIEEELAEVRRRRTPGAEAAAQRELDMRRANAKLKLAVRRH